MLVQQILVSKPSQDIITVKPDISIADAVGVLSNKRIGSVVVSADGKTVDGILSERDIVRELGNQGVVCLAGPVEDMMTRDLVVCACSDTADEVLQKMTDGRFRHMPVMRGSEMIGIISIGDVVKARLSQLLMEKRALEGMIMGH